MRRITYILVVVLGAAPFSAINLRGYNVPVICLLSLAVIGLSFAARVGDVGRAPVSFAFGSLVIGSALAFLITYGSNTADLNEFLKWLPCAGVFFALKRHIQPPVAVALLRVLCLSICVGAVFGIASYLDPALLNSLSHLGYLRTGDDERYFVLNGVNTKLRLSGTYADPNIAGIFLVSGIFLTPHLRKRERLAALPLLFLALSLTLSRGALAALAVVVLALVFASRMSIAAKFGVAVAATGLVVALLSSPTTSSRLETSFSTNDLGARDRSASLAAFPQTMAGHWSAGFGWGRPEFRDSAAAYRTNIVANAPLAAIYRGGMLEGLPFILLSIALLAQALRALRSPVGWKRMFGAGILGLLLASQTGYGFALIIQEVCLLSCLVGLGMAGACFGQSSDSTTVPVPIKGQTVSRG